ncbi:putative leucine-rich repeat domain, L domain-containing protein [Medicago truncatula]|uniref:Putative leucine-rich repeat domain, L domain-containing protein n=1 Tax=Medicago truncatula TaxID=3880 RepID=A0A396I7U2_MEDTR|nr:putative leucine-rich repeat domain, L domain-containing protein [Medicago truncatula]
MASNTSFSGALPSSIGNLRHLSELYLSSCQFNGTLSNSLSNLTQLRDLDLSNNNFTGPMPPFGMVKNLIFLDLSYNNMSINGNDANVDQISFPNIKLLYLASCNIQSFPRFLMNQSTLISLDLSDNNIQGVVPNWIWKLQSLQWLNISHNFLTELEGSLQNLTSIWVVDLHNNQLQGCIPVFPESIGFLDYSTNNFSVIPHDIGNYLSSAFFISLSNNNLQGSIPHSLCKASNLQVLDISFNNISGTISPCLITMTSTLEALNLKKNNLNGSLPDMFPTSCVVNTLNFHGNLLHGPIPKSLSHCSSLNVLDIGSNQMVDRFPCFLTKIPTLSVLVLWNNKFYGSIECSHLVENKPNWKMIQIVDIASNNFNGKLLEKIFTSWDRMKHDEDVVSGNNYIPGSIESYYQDSVTITCKGQQMELVKILTIYTVIDFSSNSFEGPIPMVVMDFKALYVLNFSNNGLYGEIPSTVGNLKQLESLDLSNNFLVGGIPVQIASLSFLSSLNLSSNRLAVKISTGTQIQSFEESSFEGNDGLYGPPWTKKPNDKRQEMHPQLACRRLACSIDWNFISVELGFIFGLGIVIYPIMFWKHWRVKYWKLVDKTLCWIFSRMYMEYVTDRGQTYIVLRW